MAYELTREDKHLIRRMLAHKFDVDISAISWCVYDVEGDELFWKAFYPKRVPPASIFKKVCWKQMYVEFTMSFKEAMKWLLEGD